MTSHETRLQLARAAVLATFIFAGYGTDVEAATTGTLTSSNSPCNLNQSLTHCTVNVSWTVSNAEYPCVWVITPTTPGAPSVVHCGSYNSNGSVNPSPNWIPAAGHIFQLRTHPAYPASNQAGYDAGRFLAQLEVWGTNGFADVPTNSAFKPYIEAILRAGITGGCSSNAYCGTNNVLRQQMATFLERAVHGKRQNVGYSPPTNLSHDLTDVAGEALQYFAIKAYVDGFILACSTSPKRFCPNDGVQRQDMAGMLLRAKYGSNYVPPPPNATPIFTDVPAGHPQRAWIEQIYREGITSGCTGSTYCPATLVTREQMAVFVARTFRLADVPASPKYFGYYAAVSNVDASFNPPVSSVTETMAHSNIVMPGAFGAFGFYQLPGQPQVDGRLEITTTKIVPQLKEAKRLGVANAILPMDYAVWRGVGLYHYDKPYSAESYSTRVIELRRAFDKLRDEQVLNSVVTLFVIDEPDDCPGGCSTLNEVQIEEAAGMIKQVAAEYSITKSAKLWINYHNANDAPGLHAIDWAGFDWYTQADGYLSPGGGYDTFRSWLQPHQRMVLVPGGVDGPGFSKVGASNFLSKLTSDSKAIAMIPFVWYNYFAEGNTYLGIRANGMKSSYCQAGAQIKGVSSSVCN